MAKYVSPTYERIENPTSKGNFFVRLAYGEVGSYMDTKPMTTQEVIEEFLNRNGVKTPREFFEKKFGKKGEKKQEAPTEQEKPKSRKQAIKKIKDIKAQSKESKPKTISFLEENVGWGEERLNSHLELCRGLSKEFHKPFDTFEREIPKYLSQLNNAFEKFDFSANTDEEKIIKILKDGYVKSIVETKKSNGYEDIDMRKRATNQMFGIYERVELSDDEYEKYGYLDSADRAKMYGDCRIVFNKSKMIDRTTFTIGDSLEGFANGGYRVPSPIKNPSIVSLSTEPFSPDMPDVNEAVIKNIQDSFDRIEKKGSFNGVINNEDYVELQYHGKITLNDIDYIEIPKKHARSPIILEIAKRKGVKIKLK